MNITLLVIGAVLLIWAVWSGAEKLPHPFRSRSCQGRGWRQAFPDASNAQIREFLSTFVGAFAFAESERLKLRPEDLILDIYRALYPHRWQADALEVETLAEDISRKYQVNLGAIWHKNLTLGELFSACIHKGSVRKTPNHSLKADVPNGPRP